MPEVFTDKLVLKKTMIIFITYLIYSIVNILLSMFFKFSIVKVIGLDFMAYQSILSSAIAAGAYLLNLRGNDDLYKFLTRRILILALLLIASMLSIAIFNHIVWYYVFFVLYSWATGDFAVLSASFLDLANASFSSKELKQVSPILFSASKSGAMIGSGIATLTVLGLKFDAIAIVSVFLLTGISLIYKAQYNIFLDPSGRFKKYFAKTPTLSTGDISSLFKESKIPHILLVMAFFVTVTLQLTDLQQTYLINEIYPNSDKATSFFGGLQVFTNLSVTIIGIFATAALINFIGVSRSMILRPAILMLCFAFLIVDPGITALVILSLFSNLAATLFWHAPANLMYKSLPLDKRMIVKNVLSIISKNTMGLAAGCITLVCSYIPHMIPWIGALLSLVWFFYQVYARKVFFQGFINNLQDQESDVRMDALELLDEVHEPRAFKAVINYLKSDSAPKDISSTVKSLEILGDSRNLKALRLLASFLLNPSPKIRQHAIISLQRLLRKQNSEIVLYAITYEIKEMFYNDSSMLVRVEAAKFIFQHLPRNQVLKFITEMLREKEDDIKVLCIKTLSEIDLPFMDLIIKMHLTDPNPKIVAECLVSLWKIEEYNVQMRKILISMLDSNGYQENLNALKSIIRLKLEREYNEKTLKFLMLSDKESDIALKAIASLIVMSSYSSHEPEWIQAKTVLIQILENPDYPINLRYELIEFISHVEPDVLDAIIAEILDLPEEKKAIAMQGFHHLAELFLESISMESHN